MRLVRHATLVVAALAFPLVATAQWEENFDSYRDGDGIIGEGGWTQYCDRFRDAFVTSRERNSRPNALQLSPDDLQSDIMYDLLDIRRGQFRVSVWLNLPRADRHQDLFITGYNVYKPETCEISQTIRARFSFDGWVEDNLRRFEPVEIQFGSWKELRVDVDLSADTMAMYYDGQLVSEGPYLVQGESKRLIAFGINSTSESYVDDISVLVPPNCLYENTKVKQKKCRESGCPEVVPGCTTTNERICDTVDDCKKKFTEKLTCNDRREKGKCKVTFKRCDCGQP